MYKIKDEYNPRVLETFGFKLSPDHSAYEIKHCDYIIFIWLNNDDEYYIKNHLYIECMYGCVFDLSRTIRIIQILTNLKIIEEG